jgi:predicted MFS family arabinose efflux permease
MNTMVYNVGRMVGPTIAAVVYPTLGPPAAFLAYLLALCVMALCVRAIHVRAHVERVDQRTGLRSAIAYVIEDRFTGKYLTILACLGLFAGSYQTLVPLLADQVFHDAARFTGIFFACAGMGSLTAAIVLSSAVGGAATDRLLHLAPWAAAGALLGLGLASNGPLTGAAFFVLGFSLTFSATSTNASIQRRCPDAVRGALIGLYGMAYNGTMPFGYLLVGSVSEALPVRGTFATMAGVLVCSMAAVALLDRRKG